MRFEMTEDRQTLPPEPFLALFQDSGLSFPPVPARLAESLQAVGPALFSSDPLWDAAQRPALSFEVFGAQAADFRQDRPDDFPSAPVQFPVGPAEGAEAILASARPDFFLLCGFHGHGLQSWQYRYVLWTPHCGLALELPFGRAFSEPEEQIEEIERSYDLVRACLGAAREGWNYAGQPSRLYLLMDAFGFRFRIISESGVLLKEGDSLPGMLDILEISLNAFAGKTSSPNKWLSV
jgi:hypothetical protein